MVLVHGIEVRVLVGQQNMKKHFVVFAHGFGQKKDARGLFTDISLALDTLGINSVMFDFNIIDEDNNTVTVPSLFKQAEILNNVVNQIVQSNPDSKVDIISCSQGPLVVALAKPKGIRKVIFIGASLKPDMDKMIERFGSREGSIVDIYNVSRFVRRDNSLTLVPAEYWESLRGIDGISLYNSLSQDTDITLIRANQDEVLSFTNIDGLDPKIHVVNLDGNHDFTGDARPVLIEEIKRIVGQ
jgi:predicted esterase YcpF (UPF0227 family)